MRDGLISSKRVACACRPEVLFQRIAAAAAVLTILVAATCAHGGVLGYWPFDDAADPATAVDASGNGHDGLILFATYTASGEGFSGNAGDHALEFRTETGPTLEIVSAQSGAFNSISRNNALTLGFWLFGSDKQPINQFHFYAGDPVASDAEGFQSHVPWGHGVVFFDTGGCCGPDTRIFAPAPPETWKGRWNHWIFLKGGDYKAIYHNGVKFLESTSSTAPIPPLDDGIWFGGHPDGSLSIDGLIDECIVFDEALSDTRDGSGRVAVGQPAEEGSDIWQLFNLGAATFVAPGINFSTAEFAVVDQPQGRLLIDASCNRGQTVTYTLTSDHPEVARPASTGELTFDANGGAVQTVRVDALSPGRATLRTANTAGCDDYSTTIAVWAVESLDLTLPSAGIEIGDTIQGVVTGDYGSAGYRVITEPSTATTYASNDATVVSVDPRGRISAIGVGTVVITATNDGHSDAETVVVAERLTRIAFLVGDVERMNNGDQAVVAHLNALRFTGLPGRPALDGRPPKLVVFDDDSFVADQIDTQFDVVIVSATVEAENIGDMFRCLSIPLVFWETGLNHPEREGLTSCGGDSRTNRRSDVDVAEFTELFPVDFDHPITAGLDALVDASGFLSVFDSPQVITFAGTTSRARCEIESGDAATLAGGARVLADYEFQDEGTIVVAGPTGDPDIPQGNGRRVDFGSPFLGRRVFLWLSDDSFTHVTSIGRTLFDRAIGWALAGTRVPLEFSRIQLSASECLIAGSSGHLRLDAFAIGARCVIDATRDERATYASSDESIAAVSASGQVHSRSPGEALITVQHGVLTDSAVITVLPEKPSPLRLDFESTGSPADFTLLGAETNAWSVTPSPLQNNSLALHSASNGVIASDVFSRAAILNANVFRGENVEVSVDVTWDDDDKSGVYVRFSDDARSFYYVDVEANPIGAIDLYRRRNNVDTRLVNNARSPVPIAAGDTHRVGVTIVDGARIFVTVDGQPVPELNPFIDADPVTGSGRVGVGQQSNPSYFDNFELIRCTTAPEPPIELVALMDGLGGDNPQTGLADTFISPLGEDVTFDEFNVTTTQDLVDLTVEMAVYTGSGPAPDISALEPLGNGHHTVRLDRPLEPGHWVRFTLLATGAGRSDTFDVWLAHLPLDVNQDGVVNIRDATAFGDFFRMQADSRQIDIDGDGVVGIRDATAFGRNWAGLLPATQPWRNNTLPARP